MLLLGRFSGRLIGYGLGLGDEVTVTDAWPLLIDEDQMAVSARVPRDTRLAGV